MRRSTAGLIQPGGGARECLLNLRFKEPFRLISYAFAIHVSFDQSESVRLYIYDSEKSMRAMDRGVAPTAFSLRTTPSLVTRAPLRWSVARGFIGPRTLRLPEKYAKEPSMEMRAVSPTAVFDVATVAVMPLYAMMVWFPQRACTRNVMASKVFFIISSIIYVALLAHYGVIDLIRTVLQQEGMARSASWCLSSMADLLKDTRITAITWVHLLLLDLFQARWVYLDALQRNIVSSPSIVLCFMVGPIGLLAHGLMRKITPSTVQTV